MTTPINPLTLRGNNAKIGEWQQEERGTMNEQELASLLKSQGWMYKRRLRRKGKLYIYARRRNGASMEERYIAPLQQIDTLTPEQVMSKLQLDCPMFGAATECLHLCGIRHSVA